MAELTLADLYLLSSGWRPGLVPQVGKHPTQSDLETVLAGLVAPGRLIVETPCEHGSHEGHWITLAYSKNATQERCSGGSRRLVGEGS